MSYSIGDDVYTPEDEADREGDLLCLKIKDQLEDLFSDSHLAEDGFLLKHVQKNKQGYVSLKLLTCLKKVKVLTTDWYMTLAGAEYSQLLEVNDECTKVRRKEPLPQWLLCSATSKLLLAWNFAEEKTQGGGEDSSAEHLLLQERISQRFSVHGSVSSVWILAPGKELPKELQCYVKRHKELGQRLCAVVKFEHLEAVRKAYSILKAEEEESNGEGMCVVPLGFQSMHHIAKDGSSEESSHDPPEVSPENPLEASDDLVREEPSLPAKVPSETPNATSQPKEPLDNSLQRTSEQISGCNGPSFTGWNQRYSRLSWCSGDCDKDNSPSPWVLRRKFAASALKPKVASHLDALCLMHRVLRQPIGPDGSRGFRGRGKPLRREGIKVSIGWSNTTYVK